MFQISKKNKVYLLMILPAFIGFLVFFIIPVVMSAGYSFTNWSVYRPNYHFNGLDNYKSLFQDPSAKAAIANSFRYALSITIVQNLLAILFATIFSKKLRTSNLLKSIFFLPAVLSILVVGFLWSYIMSSLDTGLLNNILSSFGFGAVNWLGDKRYALNAIISTQVWQWTGWSMVIYIANLKSIDGALYEAADIDGAGKIQTFFRVTLPLLYPAVSFNILMSLIGGLKVYDSIIAMTGGGPGYATETIMTTLLRFGFQEGRNAYSCALAMVFFVIVFSITKVVQIFFKKWEDSIS